MAENKSSRAIVAEAERALFGPIAEAQSLLELYKGSPDPEAWCCLASSTLERLLEHFDNYHHLLLKHGRPKVSSRPIFPKHEGL
jgi:hypothetical protein